VVNSTRFVTIRTFEEQLMSDRTVLCALDNRDLARIFEKALEGEGYHVLVVHDGIRALAAWRENRPALVILDISLPKQDGFEVVESIREQSDSGPGNPSVILLSDSRISPHYQKRANSLGVELLLAKPVPLDRLLDEAESLVKSKTGSKPTRRTVTKPLRRASPTNRASRPMAGTFAELPFPRLLHQLHGLRATGVLLLANGRKRKAIELREGAPIAIKSNMIQECLGEVLIRNGTLDEAQHQESLDRMKRGEGLQGEILVAMELVDEAAIAAALRDQAREKLFEVFEWNKGKFKLELGGKIKRANALTLNTSPANVILEGVRSRYPISVIDQWLAANADRFLSPAASPFYRFQEIDLDEDETSLVSQIDGQHPLEKFSAASEAMRRGLFGLLVTGMFELQDHEGAPGGQTAGKQKQSASSSGGPRNETQIRGELGDLAKSLRDKNFFEILGVSRSCTESTVDGAYSNLARRVHPDRFQSASLAVRELASEVHDRVYQAYDTVRDRKRRQEYVLELQIGERRNQEGEAVRRALDSETAFYNGTQLIQKRAYEDALMQFGKALELNPDDGEYYAHYGWCVYLCNPDSPAMVEEAIEHVKRGVKLASDREKPFLFLGRLYKVVGKIAAAERMFTRAVQIQPECVEAMRELRLINLRRDKGRGLVKRLLRR
jgi:CheY-like chemotaxis protein